MRPAAASQTLAAGDAAHKFFSVLPLRLLAVPRPRSRRRTSSRCSPRWIRFTTSLPARRVAPPLRPPRFVRPLTKSVHEAHGGGAHPDALLAGAGLRRGLPARGDGPPLRPLPTRGVKHGCRTQRRRLLPRPSKAGPAQQRLMRWGIYAARHRQGANPHRMTRCMLTCSVQCEMLIALLLAVITCLVCSVYSFRIILRARMASRAPMFRVQAVATRSFCGDQWLRDTIRQRWMVRCSVHLVVCYEASDTLNAEVNDVLKPEEATYKLFESK